MSNFFCSFVDAGRGKLEQKTHFAFSVCFTLSCFRLCLRLLRMRIQKRRTRDNNKKEATKAPLLPCADVARQSTYCCDWKRREKKCIYGGKKEAAFDELIDRSGNARPSYFRTSFFSLSRFSHGKAVKKVGKVAPFYEINRFPVRLSHFPEQKAYYNRPRFWGPTAKAKPISRRLEDTKTCISDVA